MIMTLGLDALIAVFFATIVLVLKPGPYVLSVSSLAASGHWSKILSFMLGSYSGGTVIYILLLTGLSFITHFDLGFVFFMLKSLAAAWFIWLGIKGLMKDNYNEQAVKDREEKFTRHSFVENFAAGFVLTASNPYDILFVTGVIPALVHQNTFTLLDILAIRGTVITADILTLLAYIVPMLALRRLLNHGQLDLIRILASVLMIGVGLYIGYTAIMADDLISSGVLH